MKRILSIIVFCIACVAFIQSGNYVIINQVMYDSPWNEKVTVRPYSHGEFIELYNAGTSTTSLAGWTLSGGGSTEKITLPSGLSIPAQGYLIIAYRYSQAPEYQLSDLFSIPTDNSNYQIYYQSKLVLSNSGEAIMLKDADNIVVDCMEYDGTSNKSNPNRLHAENADSIAGSECKSLHRTWVEFNQWGNAALLTSVWETDYVSFATHRLQASSFYEDYLTNEQTLPQNENYIISVTPLGVVNRITNFAGSLSASNSARINATVTYYDGFGRPYESVALKQSPSRNDLVTMTTYSGLDRVTRQWLPISEEANGQPLSTESFISKAGTFYNDNRPYQEVLYEASALNREVGRVRPGDEYATHPSTQSYEINTSSDAVRLFSVVQDELSNGEIEIRLQCASRNYDVSTLYKNTLADEDGKSITTFTDKLGRVILERQNNNDTYYVYDNKGQLCYVLPPLAANQIEAGVYSNTDEALKKYAYVYKYDERGNQIYKRLPGCEPILMVYDITNTLVMSQTGNQRARRAYWTVYKYDELRRLLYSAEIEDSISTHKELVDSFREWCMLEHFSVGSQSNPMSNTGYTRGFFHVRPTTLLTVNYYDTYDFLTFVSNEDRSHMTFTPFEGNTESGNATGLLTGTRTYTLDGSGDYSETVYYYDYLGREIQRRSTNHLGGYDILSTKYDFANAITDTWSSQSTQNDSIVTEHYHYTYDHVGRPLTTTYTFNDETPIVLQSYHYDELGRVRSRHIHGGVDSVAFNYDLRNQVTQIKSSGYEQNYYYEQSCPIYSGNTEAVYNGNINSTTWTYGENVNGYLYQYDDMNRLSISRCVPNSGRYSESFGYDAHGNITSLTRWGSQSILNELSLNYDGNQLINVDENQSGSHNYATKQYHDNNSSSEDDFAYDVNGNMVYDRDRGIAAIRYNLLNLPDIIQFANGNQIVHRYDAAGNRLATDYYTRKVNVTVPLGDVFSATDSLSNYYVTRDAFHNHIVYEVDTNDMFGIEFVHNPEGYIRYNNMNEHYHFYYIKDHLGNVRETYKIPNAGTKECVQRMQYYPSGLPWGEATNSSEQPYKYNGKEFVEMHGLDEYDYGFRFYYPSIGRFTTLDPLGEYTPTQSPYVYANNNWSNEIDFMGLMGHRTNFTVLDSEGNTVYHEDNGDYGVYQLKEGEVFDKDETDRSTLTQVGWEIPGWKNYTNGKPCYYIGMNADIFSFNEYLMYGNSRSSKTINTTIASLWHYFRGNGVAAQNGLWALSCFINTDTFLAILLKAYVLRHSSMKGGVNMEFEPSQFHIGDTSYSYYTIDNSLIIGYAINDGFWDANFIFEFLGKFIDKPEWKADGTGPNLELPNGTPYSYAPSYIILPL